MLDISRQLYTEVIDDISCKSWYLLFNTWYIQYIYIALTKQIADKYDLSVKSAFSASRGFYLQLFTGSASSADKDAAVSSHKNIVDVSDLPPEFVKVTKHRSTFSFTTVDLIKLNSMFNQF